MTKDRMPEREQPPEAEQAEHVEVIYDSTREHLAEARRQLIPLVADRVHIAETLKAERRQGVRNELNELQKHLDIFRRHLDDTETE